jgi:hypothetical protein
MRPSWLLLVSLTLSTPLWAGEDSLDRLSEALTFSAFDQSLRGKFSGTLDVEGYRVEQPSPGLMYTEGNFLFNPRLTLGLDVRWGPRIYGFVKTRIDRGFDPSEQSAEFRLDEYAVRFTPDSEGRFSVQVGKFATVVGNWVARHDSWDNPFITAPLPYENVTGISDIEAPVSATTFVAPIPADEKYEYNPIIWGSSYATGVSVRGALGRFDYAVEVKNTGPASRPEAWSVEEVGFDSPAYNARIGYRPDLRWNFGLSASDSAYLLPEAKLTLPAGHSRGDYRQRLLAQDVSFEWHHLQLWAELFESEFEVPLVGDVRTVAGYVEAKYKLTPQLFVALRVNRQVFSDVTTPAGDVPWGADMWRYDLAAGYRLTSHSQLKLQVSSESREDQGSRLNYAAQFTVRF